MAPKAEPPLLPWPQLGAPNARVPGKVLVTVGHQVFPSRLPPSTAVAALEELPKF